MIDDKKILSIEEDDDDLDVKSLHKYLEEYTIRDKNKVANDFTQMGEDLLADIAERNSRKDKRKSKQIKYILKHTKDKYSLRELNAYSYEDIWNIYHEMQHENVFRKVFKFIFNL